MDELILTQPEAGALALPVNIIPPAVREFVEALAERADGLGACETAEDFEAYASVLTSATKGFTVLDKQRLDLAREYDKRRDENVNQPAQALLKVLSGLKAKASTAMRAYDDKMEARRQEAQRLAAEARARMEAGARGVEGAQTDEEFEGAERVFKKGMEADAKANATLIEAEAPTAKGVKKRMKVESLEVTDLSLLPLTYHQPDEKKLKAHILDGTLKDGTPGLRFKLVTDFSGTGR